MVRDSVIHGKKAIIGWEQFKSPYQNIMHSSWLRIYSNDLHEADKHAERYHIRKGRGGCYRNHGHEEHAIDCTSQGVYGLGQRCVRSI